MEQERAEIVHLELTQLEKSLLISAIYIRVLLNTMSGIEENEKYTLEENSKLLEIVNRLNSVGG